MSNNNNNNGFFSTFGSGGGSGGGGSTSGKGIHALAVASGNRLTPFIVWGNTDTITLDKTAMVVFPFYPANDFTAIRFRFEVTTAVASSTASVVMYDDLAGKPNNKIYESSAVSTATTGIKTILISENFSKGTTYYIGVYSGSAVGIKSVPRAVTYSLGFSNTLNGLFNGYTGVASFGIPDPFGTATDYVGSLPYVDIAIQ